MNDINWSRKKERRQELKSHIWRFLLFPSFWIDTSKHISIDLKWRKIKFSEDNSSSLPKSTGIYCFVVIPPTPNLFITRYLLYAGKASSTTLKNRYENYINEMNGLGIGAQKPRIKIEEMLNEYIGHIYFFYATISNKTDIIDCEAKILN